MTQPTSPKDILLQLLDQGLVMLHINARHPDVIVPPYLKDDHHLRINLSYRFRLTDLSIDERAVSVTLSFQKQPFHCVIPFTALWGLSQPHDPENLILFPEALPIEMLALAIQQPQPHPDTPQPPPANPKPALATKPTEPVKSAMSRSPQPAPSTTPPSLPSTTPPSSPTAPPKRPTLQLVVDQTEPPPPSASSPPSPPKRPTLRLVKGKDE